MILLLLSVKRLFNVKALKLQTDSNLKRDPVALVDPDTARVQPTQGTHTIILNNLCFLESTNISL